MNKGIRPDSSILVGVMCGLLFLQPVFGRTDVRPRVEEPAKLPPVVATPPATHFPLFLKVLGFDRNLKSRVGKEIVWGLIFQETFQPASDLKRRVITWFKKAGTVSVDGLPLRIAPIALENFSTLKIAIEKEMVDVLYITPLRAVDIKALAALSRSLRLTTFTGVPAYCEDGLAVSIGAGGGEPLIMINRDAAVIEGADFSSQLLRLADVVGE